MSTSGPGAIPSTSGDYSTLTTNVGTGKVKATKGPDTLTKIDSSKKVDTIASAPANLDRPQLPVGVSQVPQALIFIAEAFAAIFTAMASTSNIDLTTLAQDQNLNITQSKGVLDTTNATIDKQEKELQEYNKIKSEADNPWLKILQIVLGVVMAAVIIATIVSGIVDGGASEAAVPEEIAGATAAEGAVAGSAGGASAATSAIAETSMDAALEAASGGATAPTVAATATTATVTNASSMIAETSLDALTQGLGEGAGDAAEGAGDAAEGAGDTAEGAGAADDAAADAGDTAMDTDMEASESISGSQLSEAADSGDATATRSADEIAQAAAKQAARTAATEAGDTGGGAVTETSFMGETATPTSSIAQMTEGEAAEGSSVEATGAASTQALSTSTRVIIGMLAGAIGGLPDLISGIQSVKLAGMYKDLANLQKEVGKASSEQSLANSYFQFLQSACKRMSSLATSQIGGGGEVVKAYADILATFQQAAQTSRQSVV